MIRFCVLRLLCLGEEVLIFSTRRIVADQPRPILRSVVIGLLCAGRAGGSACNLFAVSGVLASAEAHSSSTSSFSFPFFVCFSFSLSQPVLSLSFSSSSQSQAAGGHHSPTDLLTGQSTLIG